MLFSEVSAPNTFCPFMHNDTGGQVSTLLSRGCGYPLLYNIYSLYNLTDLWRIDGALPEVMTRPESDMTRLLVVGLVAAEDGTVGGWANNSSL